MHKVYSPRISRLIGTVHLLLGGMIGLIYVAAVLFGNSLPLFSFASGIIFLFLASAAYQRYRPPTSRNMVWGLAIGDLLLLLLMIWSNTALYGGLAAAALKSPSFVFIFPMIALQVLRRSHALILVLGGVAAGGHLVMFRMALERGADLTASYTWFQNSPSLMLAAEGELIVALILFSLFLAFALKQNLDKRDAPNAASRMLASAPVDAPGFSLSGVRDEAVVISTNRPLKILIAEDNQVNMLVLEKMLASNRFELVLAEDGQQAIDEYDQMREEGALPDVVLLDIDMPLMTGHETATEIRKREAEFSLPSVPIIAVTAHKGEAATSASMAAGMNDHLVKPVRQEELLTAISCALAANTDQQFSLPL